jgi:hypothetical protein
MSLPKLSEKDLSNYFKESKVISETAEQLKKDFSTSGINISLSVHSANVYEELFDQLKPIVSDCLDNNYQKLLQLLYHIDLNERITSETVNHPDTESLSSRLTQLIIFRELQKVIIRNHYK